MYASKLASFYRKRGAARSSGLFGCGKNSRFPALKISPHLRERGKDSFHGALANRGVSIQDAFKGLSSEDAGDQPHGSPAVAHV